MNFICLLYCNSTVPSLFWGVSEPPDVGNWFSSYQYKSPDPDSNVNFEDSAFKGCESEKDEESEKQEVNCPEIRSGDEVGAGEKLLRPGTYFGDDKHNEDQSLAEPKDLDAFSSDSVLLSEPPDIRNWFSSYVYESPMPDTSSPFEDSGSSRENGCGETNLIIREKVEYKVSRENVDTRTRANPLSSRDDGSVEMKEKVSFASTSHLEKALEPCPQQDKRSQHNVNPTKCEESMSLCHGSDGCKKEHTLTFDMDKNSTRPPDSVQKTDMKEATSNTMIKHGNRGSSATTPASVVSEWKSTCPREKENTDMTSMNGFLTTRKNRDGATKDENCGKKAHEKSPPRLTKVGRDSTACKKEGDMKRKAFAELTNIEICNDVEITGKWKCPRKGKPYAGPALKQLRLEQWVNRN